MHAAVRAWVHVFGHGGAVAALPRLLAPALLLPALDQQQDADDDDEQDGVLQGSAPVMRLSGAG